MMALLVFAGCQPGPPPPLPNVEPSAVYSVLEQLGADADHKGPSDVEWSSRSLRDGEYVYQLLYASVPTAEDAVPPARYDCEIRLGIEGGVATLRTQCTTQFSELPDLRAAPRRGDPQEVDGAIDGIRFVPSEDVVNPAWLFLDTLPEAALGASAPWNPLRHLDVLDWVEVRRTMPATVALGRWMVAGKDRIAVLYTTQGAVAHASVKLVGPVRYQAEGMWLVREDGVVLHGWVEQQSRSFSRYRESLPGLTHHELRLVEAPGGRVLPRTEREPLSRVERAYAPVSDLLRACDRISAEELEPRLERAFATLRSSDRTDATRARLRAWIESGPFTCENPAPRPDIVEADKSVQFFYPAYDDRRYQWTSFEVVEDTGQMRIRDIRVDDESVLRPTPADPRWR